MLERQHSQLIAGVHEMYKLLQRGDSWPSTMLESLGQNEGQPLTHQILEALGVLQTSPQEDADDPNREWQTFEQHPQDDGIMNASTTTSPVVQNSLSPKIRTPKQSTAAPRSTIVQQRRSDFETDPLAVEQYNFVISPLTTFTPYLKQEPPFSANTAYSMQQHQQAFPDQSSGQAVYDETMGLGGNTPGNGDIMALDWTGVEDMFDSNPPVVQPVCTG